VISLLNFSLLDFSLFVIDPFLESASPPVQRNDCFARDGSVAIARLEETYQQLICLFTPGWNRFATNLNI
jgi:hypothetical protein